MRLHPDPARVGGLDLGLGAADAHAPLGAEGARHVHPGGGVAVEHHQHVGHPLDGGVRARVRRIDHRVRVLGHGLAEEARRLGGGGGHAERADALDGHHGGARDDRIPGHRRWFGGRNGRRRGGRGRRARGGRVGRGGGVGRVVGGRGRRGGAGGPGCGLAGGGQPVGAVAVPVGHQHAGDGGGHDHRGGRRQPRPGAVRRRSGPSVGGDAGLEIRPVRGGLHGVGPVAEQGAHVLRRIGPGRVGGGRVGAHGETSLRRAARPRWIRVRTVVGRQSSRTAISASGRSS